ncbi:hypothetical protein ACHHYP_10901 [Achlya hypogyna]|uniref:Uncharacterized protein n=1 Tax=Achlya hypogyna TaxID=1202772 RepID=A0A1V9ZI69_ACHHY|nr:hypothetical protein ACHHYP_10901 [Achlya hypogyna]
MRITVYQSPFNYVWSVLYSCVWFNVWRVRNDWTFRSDLPLPSPWTTAVKAALTAKLHRCHSLVHDPGQPCLLRLLDVSGNTRATATPDSVGCTPAPFQY